MKSKNLLLKNVIAILVLFLCLCGWLSGEIQKQLQNPPSVQPTKQSTVSVNPSSPSHSPILTPSIILIVFTTVIVGVIFIAIKTNSTREIRDLKNQVSILTTNTLESLRPQWVESLPHNLYRNEVEVEIKFIYPLLGFLGYSANDMEVRVNVPIQVGRQIALPVADWVIKKEGKPFFVIEAKRRDQPITNEVLAQARSYAYGLNINLYVVTNGNDFQIYTRGNEADRCLLSCHVDKLDENWKQIKMLIG
jgi:hypothetical protein